MNFFSHLHTAVDLIGKYKGDQPFANYLKAFFKENKKHGSNDRKSIAHLCYCYFRLGHACSNQAIDERIIVGLFLCSVSPSETLKQLRPEWNELASASLENKLSELSDFPSRPSSLDFFPCLNEISGGINQEEFAFSHLQQPDLFVRIRPGNEKKVINRLKEIKCEFDFIAPFTVRLPNGFPIDKYLDLNKEIVIQDLNSQRVLDHGKEKPGTSVWDCCAGSGGKSMLAWDLWSGIELTVSDRRESILSNLRKRFKEAWIKKYNSYLIDLSTSNIQLSKFNFKHIIADVPCTGSGTWSRTPEQLIFFSKEQIDQYSELQKKITANVIPALIPGGRFTYITCSVFKKENEDVVNFLLQNFPLELQEMKLLIGYNQKADTMFVANFIRH